jgi:prepilin-type N-terminal cleavage/methylation domain-containing protein
MTRGFTLAELLIALAILGVIATFTIPKVLQSQQDTKAKAVAKELASAVSGAFMAYKQQRTVDQYTEIQDLTPYLNYISVQTTGSIDHVYTNSGSVTCGATAPCLVFANGAKLWYYGRWGGPTSGNYFGGTANNRYVYFYIDPDGQLNSPGTTNGPGKSVHISLYYNGRISDLQNCLATDGTYFDGADQYWCGTQTNPPWFNWD